MQALALGILLGAWSCPGQGAQTPAPASDFDAARAWRHLETQVAFGPRISGTPENVRTRDYIAAELTAAGLEPQREPFVAATPAGEIAMENVYADLAARGADAASAPMIVLGSHFDTKRMPFVFLGANDAASSTAALLEIARTLAAGGPRRVSYRFLFVDGEESVQREWRDPDNRYGSRHHAAGLAKSGAAARVGAFVLLDLVGDKDLRLMREEYSDQWLLECFFAAARKNGLGRHVDGKRLRVLDDHLSFLAINVPSADLIDFDYGPGNSWWHSADDTLDKCSRESLDAIGRIVLAGLPAVEERLLAGR